MNEIEINEIANTLEESELFDWTNNVLVTDPHIQDRTELRGMFDGNAWPTADESERVLGKVGKIGLQVLWANAWCLCRNPRVDYGDIRFIAMSVLDGIPEDQRTLANNAALAWLCKNRFNDLKTAVSDYRTEIKEKTE